MKTSSYSPEEDEIIKNNTPAEAFRIISEHEDFKLLGRTLKSVSMRRYNMKARAEGKIKPSGKRKYTKRNSAITLHQPENIVVEPVTRGKKNANKEIINLNFRGTHIVLSSVERIGIHGDTIFID